MTDIPKYNNEILKRKSTIAHLPANERIKLRGYRSFIGAHNAEQWYSIGRLQYFFLVSQGLESKHKFLDIGCGSLRLGQYLIPYLDESKYFGLEPEKLLVECGLANEISDHIFNLKKPSFSYNYEFKFNDLNGFDYAMANSILTHLTPEKISLCFLNLFNISHSKSRFYFTYFEGKSADNPKISSHANFNWKYSFSELQSYAKQWNLNFIGDWNHPRGQMMVEALPKKNY